MYMCGNHGDPIVAKDTLEIFRYFREYNPNMWLSMNTNAGARDEAWWTELAQVFSRMGAVIFSVDGPSDTNPFVQARCCLEQCRTQYASFYKSRRKGSGTF